MNKKTNQKILAIIQARIGSTRLPGKMMKEIMGKPLIYYILDRVKKSKTVDNVIVATSEESKDDIIYDFCKKSRINVFRGSENNVLDRFYKCAKENKGDVIIRISGDSPLIDAELIDDMVKQFHGCDYLTNALKPFVPKGTDFEILTFDALKKVHEKAKTKEDKEHVTKYIYEHKNEFIIREHYPDTKIYRPDIKLTVDTDKDFEVVSNIIKEIYGSKKEFHIMNIIQLLDKKPEIYTSKIDKKIRIGMRVDGSRKYGFGHFNRCLSLSKELMKNDNINIIFILRKFEGYDKAIELLRNQEYALIEEKTSFSDEMRYISEEINPDFMITDLDYRSINDEYYNIITKKFKTIVIDDMGHNKIDSKVIINESIVEQRQKYNLTKNTMLFAGPKHMILKKQFADFNKKDKPINKNPKNILISLGGADPKNNLEKVLDILKNNKNINVKVVASKAYKNIDMLIKKYYMMKFIINADDMYKIMFESDMIICNGGVTLYEANCIGVPSIVVAQNIEEEGTGKRFEKHGSSILIKELNDNSINKALKTPLEKREYMSSIGKKLVDGNGLSRVKNIISFTIANNM